MLALNPVDSIIAALEDVQNADEYAEILTKLVARVKADLGELQKGRDIEMTEVYETALDSLTEARDCFLEL